MYKLRNLLLIFAALILLSGCSATYEITIKDNNIKEKLVLKETDQSKFDLKNSSGWTTRELFQSLTNKDKFSEKNYEVKEINDENMIGVQYDSNINKVINSSILNQCYINPGMIVEDGIVSIETGEDFKCYEYYETLDSVDVVIITNHKVKFTNADTEENGKYTWHITKDGNKEIRFSYYENEFNNPLGNYLIVIVVLGILILLSIVYLIVRKNKKSNIL